MQNFLCSTCHSQFKKRSNYKLSEFPECDYCALRKKCPSCNCEIVYSTVYVKRTSVENKSVCDDCRKTTDEYKEMIARRNQSLSKSWTAERKKQRSEKYTGGGNPFYGKSFSAETISKFRNKDFSYTKTLEFSNAVKKGMENIYTGVNLEQLWTEKYGEEEAKRRMEERSKKLSIANSGENNPMFGKPAPFNAGNGFQGWYYSHYFRSIRELSYMIYLDENEIAWKSAESSAFKISYSFNGVQRNYFPDFVVNSTKLVECKPAYLHGTPLVYAKTLAAIEFCKEKNMTYEIIDPEKISTEKLRNLIENKIVTLTEKTLHKWQKIGG